MAQILKERSWRPHERSYFQALFDFLSETPDLCATPHTATSRGIVSEALPNWEDLAAHGQGRPDRHHGVWETCARNLAAFVAIDDELRTHLARRSAFRLAGFPVAKRFDSAVHVATTVAGLTSSALGQTRAFLNEASPTCALFNDPKPANVLVPRGSTVPTSEYRRIDFDLMTFDCPIALQVLLVYFSAPWSVAPTSVATAGADFHLRWEAASATARSLGLASEELRHLLVYHILRNLSAVQDRPDHDIKRASFASLGRHLTELV
ncbi:MAG: hypothetical protein M3O32_00400 [Actinomycetota bacterium]|nr:hypothetical protein [Actinomycetota bacterium]